MRLTTQAEVMEAVEICQHLNVPVFKNKHLEKLEVILQSPFLFVKSLSTSVYPNSLRLTIKFYITELLVYKYHYYHGIWMVEKIC